MKVGELLNEQNEDCIGQAMQEIFNDEYEDIAGIVGLDWEELIRIMREVGGRHSETNFQKEEQVVLKLVKAAESGEIFVPKQLAKKLDELDTIIGQEGDTGKMIPAIQNFVLLLNKHATTESAWEQSESGQAAYRQAEENCGAGSAQDEAGMRDSDFF